MNLLFEMLGTGKGLGQHALPSLVLLPVRPHAPSWANAQTCLSCLRGSLALAPPLGLARRWQRNMPSVLKRGAPGRGSSHSPPHLPLFPCGVT